jgi:hypothetical protein
MSPTTSGIALIGIGAIAMLGAGFNWWIVTRPRRLFNMLFGETAARLIYFVIGSLLFIRGIGQLIGKNWI